MYSYLGLQNFSASLTGPLSATDTTPALRFDAAGRLCAGIGQGNHTYLTIECPAGFEIVRASCSFGTIVIERGQDGTHPQPFPIGACVKFAWVGAAIADMVEQVLACPKPCVPASIKSGGDFPDAQAGIPYEHRVVISGTPPFALGEFSVPDWMTVELDAGEIRFSGTPFYGGTYLIQVPLNSCGELRSFVNACVTVTTPVVVT